MDHERFNECLHKQRQNQAGKLGHLQLKASPALCNTFRAKHRARRGLDLGLEASDAGKAGGHSPLIRLCGVAIEGIVVRQRKAEG